ncbi:MAG: hypothetical protein JW910_02605, partial [Anaerolineae bacterium]|nr:hypothetical protein [Anaerolineae bacterium]
MATKARRARRSKRLTQINPRWILAGAALVIAVGLGLLYITRDTSTIAPQSIPSQPELTTDFTLPGLDGTVSLADF